MEERQVEIGDTVNYVDPQGNCISTQVHKVKPWGLILKWEDTGAPPELVELARESGIRRERHEVPHLALAGPVRARL